MDKDDVGADKVTAFAKEILRQLIFRLIFVSTMERLAAVTVGFIGGLIVGCFLLT